MSKYYVDAYMGEDKGIVVNYEDFTEHASAFNVDNEELSAVQKILSYMEDLDNDEYIIIMKQVW